jgi:exosortase A-associated hydrolase 1
MKFDETPIIFGCEGEQLVGIVARPARPAPLGVIVIVGGPQYRVGSHRQFVLLARHLAERGYASLRFDYRGMGDASGAMRSFEDIRPDFAAAMAAFERACPNLTSLALWGLCDAASAALIHGARNPRVIGLALLNPWVRSEASLARAQLKHYYLARLRDAEFWRKALRGGLSVRQSFGSLARSARLAVRGSAEGAAAGAVSSPVSFRDRMLAGLEAFDGRILLVLSGRDLTAREFSEYADREPRWVARLNDPRVQRVELSAADHTFSSARWRTDVAEITFRWLGELGSAAGKLGTRSA